MSRLNNLGMAKKKRASAVEDSEFPILARLGLYASNTLGDGNCLFRALSDQLYGFDGRYAAIRSQAISYMQANRDKFEAFVGEFGETFDQYIDRLAQDGVYGGHMEIVATAWSYGVDINIYQADSMYVVQNDGSAKPSDIPAALNIAYHTWEHYSSVRNQAGPHSGPPEVSPTATEVRSEPVKVPRWKLEIVLRSLPDADEAAVLKQLEAKDVGQVIEDMLTVEGADPETGAEGDAEADAEIKVKEKEKEAKQAKEAPVETKPKRQTARDRKEQARKQALERKLNKHKRRLGEAGGSDGRSKTESGGSRTDPKPPCEINPIYL